MGFIILKIILKTHFYNLKNNFKNPFNGFHVMVGLVKSPCIVITTNCNPKADFLSFWVGVFMFSLCLINVAKNIQVLLWIRKKFIERDPWKTTTEENMLAYFQRASGGLKGNRQGLWTVIAVQLQWEASKKLLSLFVW